MRESQLREILRNLKEIGVKRFAIRNDEMLRITWEFLRTIREFGCDLCSKIQVLKKITKDYLDESYEAFVMRTQKEVA